MKGIKFTICFCSILFSLAVKAQFLGDSAFKIYRGSAVGISVVQINFNNDYTYKMYISEYHCSLCDPDELRQAIDSNGQWTQVSDSLHLIDEDGYKNTFLILDENTIRPLLLIGYKGISKERKTEIHKRITESPNREIDDFHLVYDTYPNGMVKKVVDKYRYLLPEYVIDFHKDGRIKSLEYFWNGKRSKKLR